MTDNLTVDELYDNFCLSPDDFYQLDCKVGDDGFFGNSVEEVHKNMRNNNIQKLDGYVSYSFTPYCSNRKQYKMFYIIKRNNREV